MPILEPKEVSEFLHIDFLVDNRKSFYVSIYSLFDERLFLKQLGRIP